MGQYEGWMFGNWEATMKQTLDATFTGQRLSPRLGRSPEGYLIALDCIIARTATIEPQLYRASEVEERGGDQLVRVYRLAEDVFSDTFLGSLEGKLVVGPGHPSTFLTRDNFQTYMKGVLISPRKGPRLSNGEMSIVADILIFDEALGEMVENGLLRELSLGYGCTYEKYKDGYRQRSLLANHCALVPKARAGSEVRVWDSKGGNVPTPEQLINEVRRIVASVRQSTLTDELDMIRRSADETARLSRTGIGPFQFAEELRKTNPAYRNYDQQAAAGKKYEDECRAAGEAMRARFTPKSCVRDSAPVRPHAVDPSEDFVAAAARVGRTMRGR